MLPDIDTLDVDNLCPFYMVVSSDERRIIDAGSTLKKIIGSDSIGGLFDDYFSVERPKNVALNFNEPINLKQAWVLSHRPDKLNLRGTFIPLTASRALFAGTVVVSSANTLKDHNLHIADFSPADPTPDLIILHRFRDMQLQDQQRQIESLTATIEARDMYSKDAHTDELTGIGNRRYFWTAGDQAMDAMPSNQIALIIIVDLRGFKNINDTFGHVAGDKILQVIAKRCKNVITDRDIAARLGGDEFALLYFCEREAEPEQMIKALRSSLLEPIQWEDRQLSVRASFGATYVTDNLCISDALKMADLAMYAGRKLDEQGNTVSWFTHELGKSLAYRNSVLASIDDAITQRQIVPWFQPIVDLEDGSLHGFEALARWHHPELGLIFPDVFIEVAAEAGCLHRLDALMLESSLDQLKIWAAAGKHYIVHVNLSGTSVLPGLECTVIDMLKERGLTPDRIALELTETNILNFDQQTKEGLDSLSAAGIAIHLDDFGTGFSSLTHLHDLPISGIKIDRSFLINYPDNKRSVALVNTVLNLAQTLDLEVVSEGIETEEQNQWITSGGSHYGQGYLYGKPAPQIPVSIVPLAGRTNLNVRPEPCACCIARPSQALIQNSWQLGVR